MTALTRTTLLGLPTLRRTIAPGGASRAITLPISGVFRVEDPGVEGYLVWMDEGSDPDTTLAPTASGSTLPISIAASAGTTQHVATKFRNAFGLVSEPEVVTVIEIDAEGDAVAPSPSAPVEVTLTALAGGMVRARAAYYNADDGTLEGDGWNVYASVGSDPDPSTDTPVATVSIARPSAAGIDRVSRALGPYSHGDDVRVVFTVTRSDDGAESAGSAVATIAAVGSGPSPVEGASINYGGAGSFSL